MKKLPGVSETFYYTSAVLSVDDAGDDSSDWDEQLYFEIFDKKKEKIGSAGFVYRSSGAPVIWPCDYYDLAIEIDEKHQKKGIGTQIFRLAETLSERRMIRSPNFSESTEAGRKLFKSFLSKR